jgi:hypothetical protein
MQAADTVSGALQLTLSTCAYALTVHVQGVV